MSSGLIIDTRFATQLQCQAFREGLTSLNGDDVVEINSRMVERCLQSILILGPATYFALESNLFVDSKQFLGLGLCKLGNPHRNRLPFYESDNPTDDQVNAALQEVRFLRRLVTPFLHKTMKGYLTDHTLLDKAFGISYSKLGARKFRSLVEALPELAIQATFGNWDPESLEEVYPKEAVDLIDASFLDATLIQTILHFANEPKMLLAESHERQLPVLSDVVRPPARAAVHFHRSAAEELTVVKYALSEAGLELPRIVTIDHLLTLLDDDRVLSFRSQVDELTSEIRKGNFGAIKRLQGRVEEATRSLSGISKQRRRLQWAFLFPIATALVETAIGLLPAASVAFSLGVAVGDVALARKEGQHKWVWLCTHRR